MRFKINKIISSAGFWTLEATIAVLIAATAALGISKSALESSRMRSLLWQKMFGANKTDQELECTQTTAGKYYTVETCSQGKRQVMKILPNKALELGFSSLEIIACLGIVLPTLICLVVMLNQGQRELGLSRSLENIAKKDAVLSRMLQLVSDDLDAQTLPIAPLVHRAGLIQSVNGSKNAVMSSEFDKRPDPKSNAISYLYAPITNLLQIKESRIAIAQLQAKACRVFGGTMPKSTHNYLLIGASGIYEGRLNSQRTSAKDCLNISLTAVRSLLLQSIPSSLLSTTLRSVHLLLPIEELYTIYLSRSHTLRYLQHVGNRNIENQPLADDIFGLKLSLEAKSSDFGPYEIKSHLQLANDVIIERRFANSLPKIPLENLVLNVGLYEK